MNIQDNNEMKFVQNISRLGHIIGGLYVVIMYLPNLKEIYKQNQRLNPLWYVGVNSLKYSSLKERNHFLQSFLFERKSTKK